MRGSVQDTRLRLTASRSASVCVSVRVVREDEAHRGTLLVVVVVVVGCPGFPVDGSCRRLSLKRLQATNEAAT